ncbi:Fis family transcriptional regulator [Thalassotalea sediminis]|uniref:Fis family transcriptional regulator n=1 Tax=Thalassotalea sediminis TaxID=1759089 RepID=UPI0025738339|nr:Fis family transcriptional regulator [Thalassotalea sediminis]
MRKTDKKIDNQLREVLTDVCEVALLNIDGFKWLTHLVNYKNFPQSLQVVCVFDSDEHLAHYLQSPDNNNLAKMVQHALQKLKINVKNMSNHIRYDTEQRCEQQHAGNWAQRLEE